MALVHANAFEHFATGDVTRVYQTSTGLSIPASLGGTVAVGAYGPFGGPGLQFSGEYSDGLNILGSTVPSGATFIEIVDFVCDSTHSENAILGPLLSAAFQCCLTYDGSTFRVRRGSSSGTLLGTVSYTYTPGTPIVIAFKVVLSTTVGTVDVRIYEASNFASPAASLSLTGVNTRNGASDTWTGYHLGAASDGNTAYGNRIVMDGSGSAMNDLRAPVEVSTLWASNRGVGSLADWALSSGSVQADLLSEETPDDDTTYLSDSTMDHQVSVLVDALANTTRAVLGAELYLCAKHTSGAPTIVPIASQSGSVYTGNSASPGSSYSYARQAYSAMPDGSAFSATAFQALEWGAKVTSSGDGVRLTQLAVCVVQARGTSKNNAAFGYGHTVSGESNLIAGQRNSVTGTASEAHGTDMTVTGSRSIGKGLDGDPHTLSEDGREQIYGALGVSETFDVGTGGPADNAVATFNGAYTSPLQSHSPGGTLTLDLSTGNEHYVALSADCAITFDNETDGGRYIVYVVSNGHAITWDSRVRWAAGTAPTLTAGGKLDLTTFGYLPSADRFIGAYNLNYDLT
jgi:hypothetical protein